MLIDSLSGLSPKTTGVISGLKPVQLLADYRLPAGDPMWTVQCKGSVLFTVSCDTLLYFDIWLAPRKSAVEACAS